MTKSNLLEVLDAMRQQAAEQGTDTVGSHQLNAHWSLAYACERPPESWEIYRVPSLHNMPFTDFYVNYPAEIQEALQPYASWELLRQHALPKLELDAGMSKEDCKRHGYPGKSQYFDVARGSWQTVDVPAVRWFDGRELIRESLLDTKEEMQAKVAKTLQRYKDAVAKDFSEKRLQALASYEKFIRDLLPERLGKFDQDKARARAWLRRLDATPDFGKTLFTLVREAENEVRQSMGIPLVGEAWVSETELLYRVRQLLPDREVIAHGQPRWLGRQHLDIWIPSLNVAIEYHGVQHYRAVEYFGGDGAFKKGHERDNRKRALCQQNGVRLVEIAYDQDVDDTTLKSYLAGR